MKYLLIFIILIISFSCTKQKTVLICGDHVCINKAEAEKYFEENLTLEVKVFNIKDESEPDLVELNLKNNSPRREVRISEIKETKNKIKVLSKDEIKRIKTEIKRKKRVMKTSQKKNIKGIKNKNANYNGLDKSEKKIEIRKYKNNVAVKDVCTLLEKCSIEEISKYLIKETKKKGFPDITQRQIN